MNNKLTFLIGILGVSLFVISSIVGGLLIENYNILSQFISESYAIDTEYGIFLINRNILHKNILHKSNSCVQSPFTQASHVHLH